MKAAEEKQNEQQVAAAVEQIKQDFKRIQLIRNEMVDNLLAKKPLDYKLISDQTGEINKRANRLKTYMIPPGEKEKNLENQIEFDTEQMKGALVKLCNLIYSFTKNPALKSPNVVDVQQSNRFRADLQSIIGLSSSIRKSAETLSRTSQ